METATGRLLSVLEGQAESRLHGQFRECPGNASSRLDELPGGDAVRMLRGHLTPGPLGAQAHGGEALARAGLELQLVERGDDVADAARTLILGVAILTGRTLGEMATHLRSLPRFNQVQAQWAAQGMEGSVAVAMEEAAAVEVVVEQSRALVVLTSPQAPVAINVLARSGSSGSAGGPSGTVAIQHRGGNKQVILSTGERWHLPRGKSYRDIPAEDRLGDELQAAVREEAAKWSRAALSNEEAAAIDKMRRAGKEHRANLLERQARGRWVERQVANRFPHLSWNQRGVDVTGPGGQSYHYEILSGTESNFALHGRRMASTFFRMIFF